MKTKIFMISVTLLLLSCKEEVKQNETIKSEPIEETRQLVIEVTLKTSKADNFKVFANDVFLNNDQSMNISIIHKLQPKPEFEKMVFSFPKGIKPDYQLGLNMGIKYEKEVQLERIKLNYGVTEFNIVPEKMNDFLVFNKFIRVDSTTSKIKTSKVDNKHNPILFFRRKILDSIQNIY